jgi:hypothetical protein
MLAFFGSSDFATTVVAQLEIISISIAGFKSLYAGSINTEKPGIYKLVLLENYHLY